jgi:beta propeller repeat protein
MKTNKKLYSLALVSSALILFLILVSSTASASITETRITTHGMACEPQIYGDKIVWEDLRNENDDIYMYDLSTKKELQITTNKSIQECPSIYGNKIVWEDESDGRHDIYMEDLSTKTQVRISKSGSAYNPEIYGNKIVWEGESNGNEDIYMYDLSTKKEIRITTSGSAYMPTIYGNKIVYSDDNNGNFSIYVYDLSTSKRTLISNTSIKRADIYEDRIVWVDFKVDGYEGFDTLYMYNLTTSKKTQIIAIPGSIVSAAIYGDKIIWQVANGRNSGIYVYNVSTSKKTKIITDDLSNFPDIYGDRIVWQKYSNITYDCGLTTYSYPDIYMATLSNLPLASFSASPTTGKNPLNVKFTDKSTGSPTAWEWTFGDGTNSTDQSATHNYSKAGNYTVTLIVSNAVGSNKTIKTNYIKVTTAIPHPTVIFTADHISGNVPLKVKFTDKSTGSPTSWKWSFGDGAYSIVKNPTYTYNGAGKYNVSLTVKNDAGSNKTTKMDYIEVTILKVPVAVFSASPTSGKAPLNVQFTDKSTNNPTFWKWSFGDGATKTSQNPIHMYSKAGSYTVKLTVTNAAGSNTVTKASYINVVPVPVAAFSASPTTGKHPLNVKFTDKSTGSPTSWSWNFGDKSTSTVRSPTHKYTKAGKYTVKLTVKNAAGSNSKTMTITVK